MDRLINSTVNFFLSLKLTVILLGLLLVLVFVGTLDQVQLGIFAAQKKYFESFFVQWQLVPGLSLPIFPGGFLIGLLLTLNLTTNLIVRFQWKMKNFGILISHLGLIVILLGGLIFHFFSIESQMSIEEGQTKHYTEHSRDTELVFINDNHWTVSFPQNLLSKQRAMKSNDFPYEVKVLKYFENAALGMRPAMDTSPVPSWQPTHGIGKNIVIAPLRPVYRDDLRNNVTAIIEIINDNKSLGIWLASRGLGASQKIQIDGIDWELSLRPKRFYNDYTLKLIDFKHAVYPGTDIPKNFSSLVNIQSPESGENRNVLIYMNHPLRYKGKTYYQASFGKEDTLSILQVVENRGWLLPYISCSMISLGLIVHFAMMLISRRKKSS